MSATDGNGLTTAFPPVPGVHVRTCPGCGRESVVTDDVSRSARRGPLLEVREYDCPGCAETVTFRVPSWRTGATTRDATVMGEWLERRRQRKASRARDLDQEASRKDGTNG